MLMPIICIAGVSVAFVLLNGFWISKKLSNLSPILKQIIIGFALVVITILVNNHFPIYVKGSIISVGQIIPIMGALFFGPISGIFACAAEVLDCIFIVPHNGFHEGLCMSAAASVLLTTIVAVILKLTIYKKRVPYVLEMFSMVLLSIFMFSVCTILNPNVDSSRTISVVHDAMPISLLYNCSQFIILALLLIIIKSITKHENFLGFFFPRYAKEKNNIYYYAQWLFLAVFCLNFFISIAISSSVISAIKVELMTYNMKAELNGFITSKGENSEFNIDDKVKLGEYWTTDSFVYGITDENKQAMFDNPVLEAKAADVINNSEELQLSSFDFDDVSYLSLWSHNNGYYIVLMFSEYMSSLPTYVSLIVFVMLQILIFIVLTFSLKIIFNSVFIKKLNIVNNSLFKIRKGELEEKIDVYDYKEFKDLSININDTVGSLKHLVDIQKERDLKDIELAKTIQTSALPNTFPAFPDNPEFDIYSFYQAAREIGGDYFEYFFLTKTKLLFTIGDVSGKGIPAALFMMKTKTAYKIFSVDTTSPGKILSDINNYLIIDNDAGMFVTCWLGIIDVITGELTYAVAGHNPPIYVNQSDEELKYLDIAEPNPAMGLVDNVKYKDYSFKMKPHDKLVLYTDGVTEGRNKQSELYGEDRLLNLVKNNIYSDCISTCRSVYNDLSNFVDGAEQFDDISILIFRFLQLAPSVFADGVLETEISVNAELQNLRKVNTFLLDHINITNAPDSINKFLIVIIDEIFTNLVNHAYKGSNGIITFNLKIDETQDKSFVKLKFIDYSEKFNPLDVQDPDTSTDLSKRTPGGLGIYIVKDLADEISYEYANKSNCLTIVKYY